jgi:hypothetical protein
VPDEIVEWDRIYGETPSVAFDADCVAEVLELYSGPLIVSGELDIDGNTIRNILQIRESEMSLSKTAMQLFAEGELAYLVDTGSAVGDVQEALPGDYSVVPLSNKDGLMAGVFSDTWAVSQSADTNRQHAAMLFLRHMLRADSQDALYLRNGGAMPLNKTAFDQYIDIHSDLAFLPERIGNLWLAGEDGKTLNRFVADVYENVMVADADEARIREYLENYADLVQDGPQDPETDDGEEGNDAASEESASSEEAETEEPETKKDGSDADPKPTPTPNPAPKPTPTPKPAPVSSPAENLSVSLDASSLVLGIGDSRQLSAVVTPNGGSVTWSSQNSAVASVGRTGIVMGMGPGTTTITASSGGKSASCKVSVQ